jgi:NitT/TauT family transport system ATP-binding protein
MPVAAPARQARIECRDLSFTYRAASGEDVQALESASFRVYTSEIVCLVGPSGCGKTTLLNVTAGLAKPTGGVIELDGRAIMGPGADRAVVFQRDAVFPWYTVRQNVEYGLRLKGMPKPERARVVDRYLELVGLAGQDDRYPRELSGGMRKRVDLARAYANDPEVLLMDEPFGALDAMTKEQMQIELLQLCEESPKIILFVTHDLEEALFLGDRVFVMSTRPGRIVREIDVPFERPRPYEIHMEPEFQRLRGDMRGLLNEGEARR